MGIWLFLAARQSRQQSCSWSQVQQRRATCALLWPRLNAGNACTEECEE